MARDFESGSTEYITYSNPWDPSGSHFSFSGWVNLESDTIRSFLLMIAQSDATNGIFVGQFGDEQTGQVTMGRTMDISVRERNRYGSGTLSASSGWQHVYCETNSDLNVANIECWVDDAVPGSSNTVSGGTTEATHDGDMIIGARGTASRRPLDGQAAEFATWDRLLDAGERSALAKGFSPLFFLRGLRTYIPLIGRKDVCRVSGVTPTYTGTSVTEHPRIIYPG